MKEQEPYIICKPGNIWQPHMPGKWQHPQAEEIEVDYGKGGGLADGDFVKYRCPLCGKEFWIELPN